MIRKLRGAAALLSMLVAGGAAAQSFPDRPIRLIVPYAAGGITDQVARQLTDIAAKKLGQPIVVDNRPGVNGTMGATQLVGQPADGYLLSMAPIGVFRVPHMQKTRFDPRKDFTYISMIAGYSSAVGVNADSPYKTLKDLVNAAKAPGANISYGTSGTYSSHHLAMVMLGKNTGAHWTHVPFKGDSEAITSMLGHNTQVTTVANSMVPFVQTNKIRILATFGEKRSADYPDAPTAKELGFPVVQASPFGIIAPVGVPQPVVQKLDEAFKSALDDPKFKAFASQVGLNINYRNSADYTAYAKRAFEEERETMAVAGAAAKD
ncbi:tripartite tricarboxylate transporter substrate binding protein [Imbroritus primus]|uniref:Tripartite tricarboxylate transporter substrate binding protein n=1 Tax=Imbroritus primus TaxID=3058603 RepID=A0ACD3SS96_9BURK|nr:tripartite tricarboxylate transporter substrate binding protein [Burkholderiaceae bacterium PBA]